MNLFQFGPHKLVSSAWSAWKIECDALSTKDWEGLAYMALLLLPGFSQAIGVPRGGIPFAEALNKWATAGPRLVCDDVFTTGASITKYMDEGDIGVVAFARNPPPPNIIPVFLYGASARQVDAAKGREG